MRSTLGRAKTALLLVIPLIVIAVVVALNWGSSRSNGGPSVGQGDVNSEVSKLGVARHESIASYCAVASSLTAKQAWKNVTTNPAGSLTSTAAIYGFKNIDASAPAAVHHDTSTLLAALEAVSKGTSAASLNVAASVQRIDSYTNSTCGPYITHNPGHSPTTVTR